MDEVWKNYPFAQDRSIHLSRFELVNDKWSNDNINKVGNVRKLRKTVTAALEIKGEIKKLGQASKQVFKYI
ncbi:MAG: hypothetical protein CM15mP73_5080 [Hyphomicrobiales bacterium]|nr:MAG: hypothetical protein CM15mP73_5080 [Hyphomicrobiales bacterium]